MASLTNQQTPWWTRDKNAGLQGRIASIQKLNDPTTNADELLKGSKVLIIILLSFTGILGGISYYKNFSSSMPLIAAAFFAIALMIAIEYGKNYFALWAIRIPFFKGFGHISETPANTIMWIGLILFSVATFAMSIYNSTKGGHQLSLMLSQQRDTTTLFTPNTAAIDASIVGAQKNIEEAGKQKWKGTTTTQSQRAITAQSKSIESLNRQRETIVTQQRADWEKRRVQKEGHDSYAANLVLAAGGWVELLQILLIIIRVSCEKALESRLPHAQQREEKQGIGFQRGLNTVTAEHSAPQQTYTEQPRNPIGFRRYETPPEQSAVPAKNTVEQCSTVFLAGTAPAQEQSVRVTSASVLADVKEWQKRAIQCYHRAINQQREEYRQANWGRMNCYCIMLSAVGVEVDRNDEKMILKFKEPTTYRTDEAVIFVIQEQKDTLEKITEKQRKQ